MCFPEKWQNPIASVFFIGIIGEQHNQSNTSGKNENKSSKAWAEINSSPER